MSAEGTFVPSIRGHSQFPCPSPAMLINPIPTRECGGALELQGVESENPGTGEPALPDEQALPHRACDGAKTTQGTAKWTLGKKVGDTDNINSKGVARGLCP